VRKCIARAISRVRCGAAEKREESLEETMCATPEPWVHPAAEVDHERSSRRATRQRRIAPNANAAAIVQRPFAEARCVLAQ
jgi:hypothetical protein